MAANCSHQDLERSGVSFTAHLTALYRALESEGKDPLFIDMYARTLAGKLGSDWYIAHKEDKKGDILLVSTAISARTAFIDKFLTNHVLQNNLQPFQICAMGAGLDARP